MSKTIDTLSQKLEVIKNQEYECPGPSKEVDDELLDRLEQEIEKNPKMNFTRCIELECESCELFEKQGNKVDELEEQIDQQYEKEKEKK